MSKNAKPTLAIISGILIALSQNHIEASLGGFWASISVFLGVSLFVYAIPHAFSRKSSAPKSD
jgi:hypothetical protein